MKRIILIGVLAIVLLALTITKLLSNKEEAENEIFIRDKNKATAIETCVPQLYSFGNQEVYNGSFQAYKQNNIGAELGGKVVSIQVKEGDYVGAGTVLAQLDQELVNLQIEAVNLNLKQLEIDRKRLIELEKTQVVSKSEVEKIELGIQTTSNQLKQLQKQLKSTAITAPFSGTVSKLMIELGSVIGAGTPVAEIMDLNQLKFNFTVPEKEISKFYKGQKLDVVCEVFPENKLQGQVNLVSSKADMAHNYQVQLTLQNAKDKSIKAGMYGRVEINQDTQKQTLCIPRKALIGSIEKPEVYKVQSGTVQKISFIAGQSNSEQIEILSGIEAKDTIVTKGQINLQNNSKIDIKQ